MNGAPVDDGAFAISGDTITDVGAFREVRRANTGDVLDLGERVLMPGLINAHCHLDYTCLRGSIPPAASFSAWIRSINDRKAALAPDDYLGSIAKGFAEAASFGTTTIANLEAFPELLRSIPASPLRTWWFAEMIDVRGSVEVAEVYGGMRDAIAAMRSETDAIGLAPHAPFTASAELYRHAATVAEQHDLLLTTHLAESRDEMLMFRDGSGGMFDFMQAIGRPMDDCREGTPLSLMLRNKVLDEHWIVAHLNELTESDFELLARAPRFQIVHCPRSHRYFGHAPFAIERLRKSGFSVSLGTDSLASNDDLSLFAEMRQLRMTHPAISARQLFEMVTTAPARALRQDDSLGRIAVGFKADLIALPAAMAGEELFDELLEFDEKVPWSMLNGRVTTAA
ncbi:MAG: amidohydrolase family protein [Chthoniobacterales bacterium]